MRLPNKSVRALAVSIALAVLAACGDKTPPQTVDMPAPALESSVVQAQALPTEQTWDGVVEAVNQVVISAQTNARVVELPYDVNDRVPKNAVLVRFSDVEQKSARGAAQAQVAAARATYTEALTSYDRFAAIYATGFIAKAQLDRERARRDADDPIFQGLAVSLIFGILVSTALTLLVIPLLYYVWLSRHPQPDALPPESM